MGRAVAENGPAALRTTAASFSAASSLARSPRSNARQGRPSGLATAFSLLGFRPASTTLAPLARASRAMSLPVKPVAPYMRMCFVISQLSNGPFAVWLEQVPILERRRQSGADGGAPFSREREKGYARRGRVRGVLPPAQGGAVDSRHSAQGGLWSSRGIALGHNRMASRPTT